MMTLYLVCLAFGGIFIVVSLFFDMEGDADVDMDTEVDFDADANLGAEPGKFNPNFHRTQ